MSGCLNNESNINETYIIEPLFVEDDSLTACTAVYTNELISCSADTAIFLGEFITLSGNVFTNNFTANTITSQNYYSGTTNLLDIFASSGIQLTGGTFDNITNTLNLYNSNNSVVTITGFTDSITGATYDANTGALTLYVDNGDSIIAGNWIYVSGGSQSGNTLTLVKNDGSSIVANFSLLQYFISGSTPSGMTLYNGDRWFNTTNGYEFVYIDDGDSAQWIQPAGNGGGGQGPAGQNGSTITGGTFNKNAGILTFINNSGATFDVTGFTDIYTTGFTFNQANYDLTIGRNDGTSLTQNLSVLSSDMTITGGTYNPSTGIGTFINNSGATFDVNGFLTGYTDIYLTGATFSGSTLSLSRTDNGIISVDIPVSTVTGWTTDGNSGITSSNFIGSINSAPFIIKSNNTEALRVAPNQNVLIGTSIDNGSKLRVSGNVYTSGYYSADNDSMRLWSNSGTRFLDVLNNFSIRLNSTPLVSITFGTSLLSLRSDGGINMGAGNSNPALPSFTLTSNTTNPSITKLTFNNLRNDGPKSAVINTVSYSGGTGNTQPVDLYIYAGLELQSGNQGKLILGHDGFSGYGNVMIGTATDNGNKLQVVDSLSITSSILNSSRFFLTRPTGNVFGIRSYNISGSSADTSNVAVMGLNMAEVSSRYDGTKQGGGIYFDDRSVVSPLRFMYQLPNVTSTAQGGGMTRFGNFIFGSGNTDTGNKVYVEGTLKVGKTGTTNYITTIAETTNPYQEFFWNGVTFGRIILEDAYIANSIINVPSGFKFGNSSSNTGNAGLTAGVIVANAGNIGVGNTSGDSNVSITSPIGYGTSLKFTETSLAVRGVIGFKPSSNKMLFRVGGNPSQSNISSGNTIAMIINGDTGNVAIGTDEIDNGNKLQVSGTTWISYSSDPLTLIGVTASTDVNVITINDLGVLHKTNLYSCSTITAATGTLDINTKYYGVNFNGNVDLTLPNPTNFDGREIIIKDEGGFAGSTRIRITSISGNIDGNAFVDISTNKGSATVIARGGNWWLI